jgi:biopolymer transport protein ExbD
MIQFNDGEQEAQPLVDINTTPLVDVLLVLLVMLIITIPVQLHSVNLEMPGASAPPPPVEPQVVRIDVTAAGHYLWNGEVLADHGAPQARLQAASAQAEQPEIHLRPDRAAKYDAVAAALATAQRLGLVKLGLVGSEQFMP